MEKWSKSREYKELKESGEPKGSDVLKALKEHKKKYRQTLELHQRYEEILGECIEDFYITEKAILIEISKRFRYIQNRR